MDEHCRRRGSANERLTHFGVTAFLFSAATASLASAHDLWLVSPTPRVPVGTEVKLLAQTGMEFGASLQALTPDRIERFWLQDASGQHEITVRGAEAKSLAATVRLAHPGVALAALAVKPRLLLLKAKEFNDYIKEDGLPQILAWRTEKGQLDRDSREMYSKFAKAILRAGDGGASDLVTAPLGLRIEIVPLLDPGTLEPGDELPVQILFEGRPLQGVYVYALSKGESKYKDGLVTDRDGKCSVVLQRAGLSSLHSIYMRPHPDTLKYDWESFFATLTFQIGR